MSSKIYKKQIAKYFIYCIYILIILEGSSRLIISIPQLWRKVGDSHCDSTWRIEWGKRTKIIKSKIYYEFDRYDPTKGWGVKPNIKNIPVFENKFLNTNSKGIRGKIKYEYGKNMSPQRILILGDSNTFGDEVSDDETYSYYLQQLLPRVEVINFGVHGYGHDQMLIYFKEEGIKYKPDIVILGYLAYDASRNMLQFRDYAKPKFELVNNQLILRNRNVPPPEAMLRAEFWRPKFFDLLNILYHKYLFRSGLFMKRQNELTSAILNELISTIRSIDAIPVFVYLDNLRIRDPNDKIISNEKNFFRFCKDNNIHCVYLRPHVDSARKKGIKFKRKGHYGPEMHQIIAEGIQDYFKNKGLLDNNE